MFFRKFKIAALLLGLLLCLAHPSFAGPDDDAAVKKAFETYVKKIELQAERYLVLIADHLVLDPSQLKPARTTETPDGGCAAGCGVLSGCAGIVLFPPMMLFGICLAPAIVLPATLGLVFAGGIYCWAVSPPAPPSDPFLRPITKITALAARVRTTEIAALLRSHFSIFHGVVKERLLAQRNEFEALVASSGDFYSTSEDRIREVTFAYLQLWLLTAVYEIEVGRLNAAKAPSTMDEKLHYAFTVSQNSTAEVKCRAEILRLAQAPE